MNIIVALVLLAGLLTVTALGAGVLSMAVGGDFDKQHSEQFMMARVGSQAVALVLMFLAFVLSS